MNATQQSADQSNVSIEDVLQRQQQLEQRVDELEETVEEKDERIDKLEKGLEIATETVFELEDAVTGDYGSFHAQQVSEDGKCVLERIEDIERGEIDPGEVVANSNAGVDPSDLLPLHNMYLSAQNQEPEVHDLSENQEIAARLFPYLGKYSYSNEGKMVLPSTKVKDILDREIATPELAQRLDVENPNANTVRRAMKFVGKFGKEMMEFDDSEKTNRIVIDRDAWVEYTQEVAGVVGSSNDSTVNTADDAVEAENTAESGRDEVAQEFDQLEQASDYGVVSTDGGTTVNRE